MSGADDAEKVPSGSADGVNRRTLVATGLALSLVAGCGIGEKTWPLNFKLRVRVHCDGQTHEGSSVFRIVFHKVPSYSLNQTQTFWAQGWGEAVAVDLGPRGFLFGLLGTVPGVDINLEGGHCFLPLEARTFTTLLPRELERGDAFESGRLFEMVAATTGERDVDDQAWPLFVRFENLADQSSARFVRVPGRNYRLDPRTPAEDLTDAFGKDARIERVTFEMTDERPSRQIETLLPWVRDMPGAKPGFRILPGPSLPFGQRIDYPNLIIDGAAG